MIRQTSWFSLGHRMYGRVILLRDLLLLLAESVSEKNMGGKLRFRPYLIVVGVGLFTILANVGY